MNDRIKMLLDSGYSTRDVALMLDIPFEHVLWVETEYESTN